MGGRFLTLLGCAAVAAMSVSCAKAVEDLPEREDGIYKEFHAGSDVLTRTELTEGGGVLWVAGDAVSVFDPDGANKCFTTDEGGASVTFSGFVSSEGAYHALYPYDVDAVISEGLISAELLPEQTATAGGFASGLNPSVAAADAQDNLFFRNVCALVKFTLGEGGDVVAGASLRGNGGEPLAGKFTADASAEQPSAVPVPEASETEVELSGIFEEGSVYYFVVLPGDLSEGLTLELRDGGGNVWRRQGSSEAVLTAGRVLDLGTVAPDGFAPAEGYEKIDGVYHIHTPEGLAAWASAADVLAADVVIEKDIDMTGMSWIPVGRTMNDGEGYSGDFDGNGKCISNLETDGGYANMGFFGALSAGARVHDLKFTGARVSGGDSSSAGVVAGSSLGAIENCDVSASEVSGQYAGALTGNNSVQVYGCDAAEVRVSASYCAGGISGVSYGKIEYCTLSGSSEIIATGAGSRAGGIVGETSEEGGVTTSGRVLKCAVEGAAISGTWAGGIAGENSFGIVAQCVADRVKVTHGSSGTSARLGGVVGYNTRGDIVASYSANSTIGADELVSEAEGGIVGYNYNNSAYVYGCYSTHVSLPGEVSGPESGKGSIAGYTNGHVMSCYAVLPEGVSGIKLVGYGKNAPEYCVEAGESDYGKLISGVPDLTAPDGSVWVAENIWEMTAGGAPAIVSDYISNPPAAGE